MSSLHDTVGSTVNTGPRPDGFVRLALDLPESLSFVAHSRRSVCCLLQSMGVVREDIEDLELILGELATNAVRHARGHGYTVEAEFFENVATIAVTDKGHGFSPDAVAEPGEARPDELSADHEERFGGLGLPMVYLLADDVDIQPNVPQGTIVRARKRLRYSPVSNP